MNAKKIDFNTYLEQLRAATPAEPLLIKIGRITYASYFISASGEHLVPTDYEYTVSGNNYDGYIITATINESKINK
jgi:D-alanyl-D-alanine carboxypeptidase